MRPWLEPAPGSMAPAAKAICCILALSLALPSGPLLRRVAAQDAARDAGEEADRAAAERVRRLLAALEAAGRELPRDRFEIEAALGVSGREPAKVLEWVRRRTSWVPYRGLLRGPAGVLMDRLGNSLDRALLLAEMLRAAGHQARLVRARLDANAARGLLEAQRALPAAAASGAAPEAAARIEKILAELPDVRDRREQIRLRAARTLEETIHLAAAEQAELRKALGDRVRPAAGDAAEIEAASDHWWVQCFQDGAWVDLDPLAERLPGGSPPAGAEPVPPPAEEIPGRLPVEDALAHEVEVRVVIERWKGGRLEEQPVLQRAFRPCERLGERIRLRFVPLDWPGDLDLFDKDEARARSRFLEAAARQTEWLPVLKIGAESVSRASFDDAGEANEAPLPREAATLGKGAKGLGGRVGGLLGGGREKARDAAGRLTAVWAEYEVRSPGQPPRLARREVYDAIGPAARARGAESLKIPELNDRARLERGLAFLGDSELLPAVCRMPPEYLDHLLARALLARGGLFLEIASGKAGAADKGIPPDPPGDLHDLAAARLEWSPVAASVYIAEPNLLAWSARLRLDAAGEPAVRFGYDIIGNRVAVRGSAAPEAFDARLLQGVLDTCAEAALMREFGEPQNTAVMFSRAREQGIATAAIAGAEDPAWKEIELPEDARRRAEEDLRAGYVVVLPRRGPAVEGGRLHGWWRVDPATGETLGRMEDGGGQSAVEWVLQKAILMAPGAIASVLTWYCRRQNRSDGMCNPCLIALIGLLGFGMNFLAGSSAWVMGDQSTLGYGAGLGLGVVGAIGNAGRCFDHVVNRYGHGGNPPAGKSK